MPGAPQERTTTRDVAERLRILRLALGLSQVDMCRRTKITTNAWNNYEKGVNRINVDQAIKVVRTCGVTLDWIYHGDLGGVRSDMAGKLQEPPPAAPRGRRA